MSFPAYARRFRGLIGLFVVAVFFCATPIRADTISVSAAVSLREALTDAAKSYEADTGEHVNFVFGASGTLMMQLKNGADVDAFISAANKQVDDLSHDGLIDESSRRVICMNELALIVPHDSDVSIKGFENLADASIKKLAMGEPKTVPAGQYALQILKTLKLDSALADRIVYGNSVRQVLDYVQQGEVTAGIVYTTDAKEAGDKVKVIATADPKWHEPVVYPGVVIKSSKKPAAAKRFLDFLGSEKGRAFLLARGFTSRDKIISGHGPFNPMSDLWPPLFLSLRIAIAATVLAAAVAIPLARFMTRGKFPGKSFVEALILIPLVMPPTVMGYFILVACGSHAWLGRWLHKILGITIVLDIRGAILAAAVVALPLMYIPAKAAFGAIPREMEDVARLFGANRLQTFWHVSIPLARRGLAGGLILAFARSIGEFGATAMVYGIQPSHQTMPIAIWVDYSIGDTGHSLPIVVTLTALSVALMIGFNFFASRRGE